jgi:hypothetical protein
MITTERFSAEDHTDEITELVAFVERPEVAAFLNASRPNVRRQLSRRGRAIGAIGRLMGTHGVMGGPIRREGAFAGVWMMASKLSVVRPFHAEQSGRLVGDYVDYWANLPTLEEHQLVMKALGLHRSIAQIPRAEQTLGLLSVPDIPWAQGIPDAMVSDGPAGPVRVPLVSLLLARDYGHPRHTEELQIYTGVYEP